MTGEELLRALLDRIIAKRNQVGEFTLTTLGLEQLLREALPEPERDKRSGTPPWTRTVEPGFPKKMYRAKASRTPWNPSNEVPQMTVVHNSQEEKEAQAQGFSFNEVFVPF